jgi:hypothetical protein
MLIEKLMLKLRTKAQSCLSSPNHSLDLQLAEVCLSSHTCAKPLVVYQGKDEVLVRTEKLTAMNWLDDNRYF